MQKSIKQKPAIILFSVFILLFCFTGISRVYAKNTSANVENNISATANTGGNKIEGSGTIKTGDASASVKAENYVNGEEKIQTKVEARAEVQGEGATASVEVNGEKKTCEASGEEGCVVEINNSTNNADDAITAEDAEGAEKNIIQSAASAISDLAKSITEKIISWFS